MDVRSIIGEPQQVESHPEIFEKVSEDVLQRITAISEETLLAHFEKKSPQEVESYLSRFSELAPEQLAALDQIIKR